MKKFCFKHFFWLYSKTKRTVLQKIRRHFVWAAKKIWQSYCIDEENHQFHVLCNEKRKNLHFRARKVNGPANPRGFLHKTHNKSSTKWHVMYQLHTLDGVAYEFVSLTKIWTLWVSTNDNSANSYFIQIVRSWVCM